MVIAFFGHSNVTNTEKLIVLLNETIKEVISDSPKVTFYLGGYGDFDRIAAQVCRILKSEYPNTEAVFVSPYFSLSSQQKIQSNEEMNLYDASIYPPLESVHPRYAIVKRNEWMAENADLVIAYVEYSHGGAHRAVKHAKKKGKRIINLALR